MTHPFDFRGAFLVPDQDSRDKIWQNAPSGGILAQFRENQPSEDIILFWESGIMEEGEFTACCDFFEKIASLSCAGFGFARMGAKHRWFDIDRKILYPRPVKIAPVIDSENLFPLDERMVWDYVTEFNGAKDHLHIAYEEFDFGKGPVYCTRPTGGKFTPPFFIHWANYHFVQSGRWLNLEVEESQMAPDISTYERAEPILDISGHDLAPRIYVNEEERFFQIHTPYWGNPIVTPAGKFEKVLKVKVVFYGINAELECIREKVKWYFTPGIGLVKMKGEGGKIELKKMPHIKRRGILGWL